MQRNPPIILHSVDHERRSGALPTSKKNEARHLAVGKCRKMLLHWGGKGWLPMLFNLGHSTEIRRHVSSCNRHLSLNCKPYNCKLITPITKHPFTQASIPLAKLIADRAVQRHLQRCLAIFDAIALDGAKSLAAPRLNIKTQSAAAT